MDAFVVMVQARDGDRTFYAPSLTPPWTGNLLAAGQYVRRYEAEAAAAKAAGIVLPWSDAMAIVA